MFTARRDQVFVTSATAPVASGLPPLASAPSKGLVKLAAACTFQTCPDVPSQTCPDVPRRAQTCPDVVRMWYTPRRSRRAQT
eukprot:707852-Prymnesium_polylepis.2